MTSWWLHLQHPFCPALTSLSGPQRWLAPHKRGSLRTSASGCHHGDNQDRSGCRKPVTLLRLFGKPIDKTRVRSTGSEKGAKKITQSTPARRAHQQGDHGYPESPALSDCGSADVFNDHCISCRRESLTWIYLKIQGSPRESALVPGQSRA